jgi:hypothetical protein
MKGTLRRQSLCLGTVGASSASYILQDAQCHMLWPRHYHGNQILFFKKYIYILRAAGTAPQAAAHSASWGYHGLPSQRAVRTAKIKLIVASRRVLRKRTVEFLQRMVVSALHAPSADRSKIYSRIMHSPSVSVGPLRGKKQGRRTNQPGSSAVPGTTFEGSSR